MKRLGNSRKAVALLLTCFFLGPAMVICADPSVEESVEVLRKNRNRDSKRAELVEQVLAKAKEQQTFRAELIRRLTERISGTKTQTC